jgi:hypothetical protein
MRIRQLDVSAAFLQADLEEEIYVPDEFLEEMRKRFAIGDEEGNDIEWLLAMRIKQDLKAGTVSLSQKREKRDFRYQTFLLRFLGSPINCFKF